MKTILISGPASSRSGYGQRTRDLIRSLIAISDNKYNILVGDVLWGGCPPTALDPSNAEDKIILDRFLKGPLQHQPEIFIQVAVPNEFQRYGSQLNIGITAGIETTICSPEWIEGCNRMDVIFTSSEHSKNVFENTTYQQINPQTNQPAGTLKVIKPIRVLIEGIDVELFSECPSDVDMEKLIPSSAPDFNFLFVGHWLPGDLGHDRKDVGMLIKTFLMTFKRSSNVGLILKTGTTFSDIDKQDLIHKIREITKSTGLDHNVLPPIYIVFGDLTDKEMSALYHHPKVKAHITFTKGEGFGRPLAEASLSKKPVIVPNWSGLLDFSKYAIKLSGQLQQIHHSAVWDKVLVPQSAWFYVNYSYASAVMKNIVADILQYTDSSRRQAHFVKMSFSKEVMTQQLNDYLTQFDTVVQNNLILPQLAPVILPPLVDTPNSK